MGLGGPGTRSLGERWPLAVSWGIGIGLMGFIFGAASLSLTSALDSLSPETQQIYQTIFPNFDLNGAGAFLQLAFITFGIILVGLRGRDARRRAGRPTRRAAGWRRCCRHRCRARGGRSRVAPGCSRRSAS